MKCSYVTRDDGASEPFPTRTIHLTKDILVEKELVVQSGDRGNRSGKKSVERVCREEGWIKTCGVMNNIWEESVTISEL